jgi:formylglycine-generating enzyme required for sulfatase activity
MESKNNDSNIPGIFFSYNNKDYDDVSVVAQLLSKDRFDIALDRWYLKPGRTWLEALEKVIYSCRVVLVFLGPHGLGRWQVREKNLALDRQAENKDFLVIPVLLPGSDPPLGFLSLNTWIDLRNRSAWRNEAFLSGLKHALNDDFRQVFDNEPKLVSENICPYRGLKFFREEDSSFFFGRSSFVERLEKVVAKSNLVAVLGASGSGKSSVVRAGLLPFLRSTRSDKNWEIGTMVPGEAPLDNLATLLTSIMNPKLEDRHSLRKKAEEMSEALISGRESLAKLIARILENQPGTDRVMLVIDQWEEIYTLSGSEQQSDLFIDELLNATASGDLSVVLTVRSDFYTQLLENNNLFSRLQDSFVGVSAIGSLEMLQVINQPAKMVGLMVQVGLAERILEEVENQPGKLTLLEFVLELLWKRRQNNTLTHDAYKEIGGVRGAIATHAESVFNETLINNQKIAKRIFLRLVRPEFLIDSDRSSFRHTKRSISFSDFDDESKPIIRLLADEHLIVTSRKESTGEEIVDIIHEALIEEWERLTNWIDQDQKFLEWREQFRPYMNAAIAKNFIEGTLLQGELLKEALLWMSQRQSDFGNLELQYVQKSALKVYRRTRSRKIKFAYSLVFVSLIGSVGMGNYLHLDFFDWFHYSTKSFTFRNPNIDESGRVVSESEGIARYFEEDFGNGVTLEMVKIPGGEFKMGTSESDITLWNLQEEIGRMYPDSNCGDVGSFPCKSEVLSWPVRETPQHVVKIRPFFIGKFEITQKQWNEIALLDSINYPLRPNIAVFKGDNLPVEMISFRAAMEFCERLSKKTGKHYRLPTEAEWEYACRAGTESLFPFGENIQVSVANYYGEQPFGSAPRGISREKTTVVGSLKYANKFGLYDMTGNVWEWCLDRWHDNYKGAPTDGSAWLKDSKSEYRVVRGGSWFWYASGCRSAWRGQREEAESNDKNAYGGERGNHGFRVVMEY